MQIYSYCRTRAPTPHVLPNFCTPVQAQYARAMLSYVIQHLVRFQLSKIGINATIYSDLLRYFLVFFQYAA